MKAYRRPRRKTSAVARNTRKIRRISNKVETKHCDASLFNHSVTSSTTAQWALINGMAQGLTASDRIGNRVTMTTVDANMVFTHVSGAAPQYVKAALIYDTRPAGALPAADTYMNSGMGTHNVVSLQQRNWEQRDRFHTMWTKQFVLDDEHDHKRFSIHKAFKGLFRKIYTSGAGALIADILKGAVYLYFQSDVTISPPVVDFTSRIKYQDA